MHSSAALKGQRFPALNFMNKIQKIQTANVVEAMEAAGHNFVADMVPIYLPGGAEIHNKVAVIRRDNGAYLGTVGKGYTPVQPTRFYELVQNLITTTGATIDSAVTLRGGAVMGVSVTLGDTEYLPGDPINRSFIVMTSFDSSYSVLGRVISKRWFCMNQLPSSEKIFNIKHTTNADLRLETALKMVGYLNKEIHNFDDQMREFVRTRLAATAATKWFDDLFPAPAGDRAETIATNRRAVFTNLYHTGRGTHLPGVKGTAYQALNALTEYVNHERPTRIKNDRSADVVRFEAISFGSGAELMTRGVKRLMDVIK